MPVLSTRGVEIYLSKADATPTVLTPITVSAASPAIVTVADSTGLAAGDAVKFTGTGITELDGKWFVVDEVDTGEFAAIGANLDGVTTTPLGSAPTATVIHRTDMDAICLSTIDIQIGQQSPIDVTTFCGPASILGNVAPSSLSLGGYVDIDHTGYSALLAADHDGAERVLEIVLPSNGTLIAPILVGNCMWTVPLEGASTFSFPAAISTEMRHCFGETLTSP